MTESIYLATLALPLATALLIFGMKYWSAARQARARLENDEAYRALAARATAAQAETAATLADLKTALDDVRRRVQSLEVILKQVE